MRVLTTLFAAALVAVANPAAAQAWPAKPIRVIVNFPPGGAADQLGRLIATPLGDALAQPVVVENRAGANGNIGAEAAARSAPDGYTLLMAPGSTMVVNPHLYPKLSFDAAKDFDPVAAVSRVAVFLVVRPDLPARSVNELLAYARANPGRLNYASPGSGSTPHIAGEMLKRATQIQIVHVPYKGAAPAMTDLLAGQVDLMFDPGIGLQHARAGKLRLLAVGSPKRAAAFPDTPTLAEAGVAGFDADSWFGFYAPVGTPAEITARLNREINRILETPAARERIAAMGGEAVAMSPAGFRSLLRTDSDRFGAVIREAGIKID